MKTLEIAHYHYPSPIDELVVIGDAEKLYYLDFADNAARMKTLCTRRWGPYQLQPGTDVLAMRARLERYFAGEVDAFTGLACSPGGSAFQQRVWQGLQAIPHGTTVAYQQLATDIGQARAVRAVANANANNPIAIIIPCHRVIGQDGALRGYAGGLARKAWLLRHEGVSIRA